MEISLYDANLFPSRIFLKVDDTAVSNIRTQIQMHAIRLFVTDMWVRIEDMQHKLDCINSTEFEKNSMKLDKIINELNSLSMQPETFIERICSEFGVTDDKYTIVSLSYVFDKIVFDITKWD